MAGSNAAMAAGDSGAEAVAVSPTSLAGRFGRPRGCCRAACGRWWRTRRSIAGPSWADRPQVFAAEGRGGSGWRCSAVARSRCSAGDQRGDGAATDPPRLRGGGRRAKRLLRRGLPPARPRGARQGRRKANIAAWWRVMEDGGLTRSSSMPPGAAWRSRITTPVARRSGVGERAPPGSRRCATMSRKCWWTLASSRRSSRPGRR